MKNYQIKLQIPQIRTIGKRKTLIFCGLKDVNVCNDKPTNGVTLPAATTLPEAGAVHHVALIVLFSEGCVNLIGCAIHTTLI